MKFKVRLNDSVKHSEITNSLSWTINNEVYSISDDNIIYKWDANGNNAIKFMELEVYSTDIDWVPISKGINDSFAIGFVDGSFKLITKLTKVEKHVVDAHKAALISLKWSKDGSALATCGEDGQIRTWARNGNLRSNLIQMESPIYSFSWSPDDDAIAYCNEMNIYIKPTQPGLKTVSWKAHDGVVLKVDWNASNNLIISGGEDCKYKLWDSYGRLLFSSNPYDYVITAVSWAPNGEYFAVGSFQMLKLCDKTGWSYSYEKTNVGSLLKLNWSSDSTIVAGAGGNGSVLFGYVIEKHLTWENWDIQLIDDNRIHVLDIMNEFNEDLDFKDRVINMSLGYNHLIITTSNQCYIYSLNNLNSPRSFDLKEGISLVIQSPKYFCLVQVTNGLTIYSYEGKLISNPKTAGIKFEFMNTKRISLSQDILSIIDGTNSKIIRFFDVISGKPLNFSLEHTLEITEIGLNKNEVASERKIGFIDINKDFHLSPVHKRDVIKLASMTDSFLWNERNDILISISDGRFLIWYYPNAIYVDKDLMDLCKTVKENNDIGRFGQLLTFSSTHANLRRKDGGLIWISVSPYPGILFDLCDKNKLDTAIKLCRFVKEQTLWACLAAISLYCRELNTAEIALAAIECVDKVKYINYIKELPSDISRNAGLALYFHKQTEAEQMFVQAKLFYRAIKMNIKLFRWDRALELALTHKVHLNTVLAYRKRYLDSIGKEEWLAKYKENEAKGQLDWEVIKTEIKKEKEKEARLK